MESLATLIIIFIISLFALIKGASLLVSSAAKLANSLGISRFIIGLTLVALGTSIPELATAITATFSNNPGIILGNIIGSNIANISLILGFTALFFTLKITKTNKKILSHDILILLTITTLLFLFAFDKVLSAYDCAFLLLLFLLYVNYHFKFKTTIKTFRDSLSMHHLLELFNNKNSNKRSTTKTNKLKNLAKEIPFIAISLPLIIYGSKYLVSSAVNIATLFQIPSSIIALAMISIGTTLPELTTSIAAARKGFSTMLLGNLIGSNITNILLVIGIAGLISPLTINNLSTILLGTMLLFTFLFSYLIKTSEINRLKGAILLSLYILLIISVFKFMI